MTRIVRRDIACLPWFLWIVAVAANIVLEMPPSAAHGEIVMPLLLAAIATSPAFAMVWLCRRAWLVRRGWWIPLGLMSASIAIGVWEAGFS